MSANSFLSLWHLWGLALIVLSMSGLYYYWHATISRVPASIPWVGVKDEAFSKPRAWIREFFAGSSTLIEGYFTVSSLPIPIPDSYCFSFRDIGKTSLLGVNIYFIPISKPQLIVKTGGKSFDG